MQSVNITEVQPRRRWYDDACGTAHALELLGERWAMLIVRELMFGPRRFGALRAGLPGISANVLGQRLEGLEREGIVERTRLPPPASVQVYGLTPWGYESEPIFQTLGRWATRSPDHDPSLPLSAASLMLSFRTMFDGGADIAGTIGFRLGEDGFVATLGNGRIEIIRGDPASADAVIEGDPGAIAGTVYGKLPFDAAGVAIHGDRALAERFVGHFELPAKAHA